MPDFLKFLQTEWGTVGGAPLTFVAFAALVAGVVWRIVSWHFQKQLADLSSRLTLKDEQIKRLEERLNMEPATGGEFARLSHNELQDATLDTVRRLRDWATSYEKGFRKALIDGQQEEQAATANGRTLHPSRTSSARMMEVAEGFQRQYEATFKGRLILLRQELLSRVIPRERIESTEYHYPTNGFGIERIADELEGMARQLA